MIQVVKKKSKLSTNFIFLIFYPFSRDPPAKSPSQGVVLDVVVTDPNPAPNPPPPDGREHK